MTKTQTISKAKAAAVSAKEVAGKVLRYHPNKLLRTVNTKPDIPAPNATPFHLMSMAGSILNMTAKRT